MRHMDIKTLDDAIQNHPFQPKGIKISAEMWKELESRITWKRGHIEGVIDSGFDFPVLDEVIFVHVDPFMTSPFELPKSTR